MNISKTYNPNNPILYFPRPFLFKRGWRDESEHYDDQNPMRVAPSLSKYDTEGPQMISDIYMSSGKNAFFGRPAIHWFVAFGTIATFILWTVILAMDFSNVFSSYNHYEVFLSFANATTHPRAVLDQGLLLQIPHKLVWYIMWCIGYGMSGIATIIVFFHVTDSLPAYKNIFHDIGVFFPIFNLFAALGEMAISMTGSTDITDAQRTGYWKLAEASTGILFFSSIYVFVFCRQRRSSINIIVWQCSVGFANILMVNTFVAFALVVSCHRSITENVHPTAASWISFFILGVFLFLFIVDITATFWYRTAGVYSNLPKELNMEFHNYPDMTLNPVDYLFKWTPSIYNTFLPTLYFAGLLAAWKDENYDWATTGAKFRHPVIAASIIGVSIHSMLTLVTISRAFAKYQTERNGDQNEAAVHLNFSGRAREIGVDTYATLRV